MPCARKYGIQQIIFNTVVEQPQHVINVIVLCAKQYIYRCKCKEFKPVIIE